MVDRQSDNKRKSILCVLSMIDYSFQLFENQFRLMLILTILYLTVDHEGFKKMFKNINTSKF